MSRPYNRNRDEVRIRITVLRKIHLLTPTVVCEYFYSAAAAAARRRLPKQTTRYRRGNYTLRDSRLHRYVGVISSIYYTNTTGR